MKKLIPVIIAIVLIGLIVFFNFGKIIYEKYSYGQDYADLNEYYSIYNKDDIPIVLGNERTGNSARYIDGKVYLSRELTEEYLTSRFYLDTNENLLLYTNATTTISAEVGGNTYIENGNEQSLGFPVCQIKNDTLYIAMDYIQKFVDFTYEVFDNPNHLQLMTEWSDRTVADIKSDTWVRKLAGVKALILRDVKEGETVEILEVIDDWTKVKTADAYIGYVENKRLDNERKEVNTHVSKVAPEEYSSLTRDYKINLTWHNIEYPQDGADLKAAIKNTKALNVISPTCYWLTDNDGNFKSVANANYVATAHDMGLEVWNLVSNFHSGTDVDLNELLSYTSKRQYLIENLVLETVSVGADGINVDFESVPASCADHYVQFVRELAIACHDNNLVISVDHYVPTEYTAHYNRREQGLFVDYIIIMGYDEHYAGSDVGSVSSIDWMTTGIEKTVNLVPKEKVINAVPFYTRVWKTKGGDVTSEAVTMEVANGFLSRNNITTTYDEATNQNYGEKTMDGTLYQVWMEDADSITTRLNVMNNYGIAGVASWKLGQETPDIWDVIAQYMLY